MTNFRLSAFSDEYAISFRDQCEGLRKLGIGSMELRHADGINVADLTKSDVVRIRKILDEYGISVSAIGSPLGKIPIDGDMTAHLQKAACVFETANELQTSYVRCFSFYPPEGKAIADCRDRVFAAMEDLLTLAEQYHVTLCHENEARIYGESPDACLDLLNGFGGQLRCVFDMGNFVLEGYDPVAAYEKLHFHVAYFHIKDGTAKGEIVPPGAGDARITEILAMAQKEDRGTMFVSLEPHLQTFEGLGGLTSATLNQPYVYANKEAAFTDAAKRMDVILCELGNKIC